jgi:type II secretory pathway predicted ATPase ExeA
MTHHQILSHFGLKWNPFQPDVPVEALWRPAGVEQLCWRLLAQVHEGGFALIAGPPGTGKSVALRLAARELAHVPDIRVAELLRPQSSIPDFYRELGSLFGVPLKPHNRWAGFQALRETWRTHVDATRLKPVVLVDEAQHLHTSVLEELRILASTHFDSKALLTVVLCGDQRLLDKLTTPDLLPVASRIRTRLLTKPLDPDQLQLFLDHALAQAGGSHIFTADVLSSIAHHAAGNLRAASILAGDLLLAAAQQRLPQVDAKLLLDRADRAGLPRRSAS